MNDCAHFYLANLASGKAEEHLEYILKRNIPSQMVRSFGLGASLNYRDLPKYLLDKGYSRKDILDSGAVSEAEGKLIDAQGGRLIFPIISALDEVIAFGGRVLKKTDFGKYKNTRETMLFNKSKTLYNINKLKKLKRTQTIKNVIMVEGYMDTISVYQAGFKNVVASMGTSLTQDQARLIKRYTDTVLISYDGDGAGQKANMRGLEILKDEGLNVRVVPLPDGLDPDEVIKQYGNDGYGGCLDGALPLIDYKLSMLEKSFDLGKTEEKRRFVAEALKVVRTADSASLREELLKRIRDKTGITYESLNRDLGSAITAPPPKKETKERTDNAGSVLKASRFVIASFLFGAKYADGDARGFCYASDVHKMIAGYIYAKKMMEENVRVSELFDMFEEKSPEYEEFTHVLDYGRDGTLEGAVAEKYFSDCKRLLEITEVETKIADLSARAAAASLADERAAIAAEISRLLKQKEKLKNGVR